MVDCAAAPLSAPIQRSLSVRLGVQVIRNGYGLSEVVAGAVVPSPDMAMELQRKGSVGTPLPGIEVSLYCIVAEKPKIVILYYSCKVMRLVIFVEVFKRV